jgi:hypothetical protein
MEWYALQVRPRHVDATVSSFMKTLMANSVGRLGMEADSRREVWMDWEAPTSGKYIRRFIQTNDEY